MKKFLLLLTILIYGISTSADEIILSNVTLDNIWDKTGKKEEKILQVGSKLLNANQIDKRVTFRLSKFNTINASAAYSNKEIVIYNALLNYIDNDDELAGVLSHEIAHDMDYYDGFCKLIAMTFNSKSYEFKADTIGIDYMVKAGYNPIAMITMMNKIGTESVHDFGIFWSHPKTSKRLMKMYEYIYKKYPQYLNSPMTKNINYINWTHTAQKDIQNFNQKEKQKAAKRGNL